MTTLYVGFSGSHFKLRWQRVPEHIVSRAHEPHRGAIGKALCGITAQVSQQTFANARKNDFRLFCKRCLAAAEPTQEAKS